MSDLSNTELAERVRAHRAVAHRAVTEGVNLKYVEVLRRACYEACDLADALLARLDEAERLQVMEAAATSEVRKRLMAAEADRDRAKIKLDTIALIAEQNAERHTGFKHILRVVGLEPGQALRAAATEEPE